MINMAAIIERIRLKSGSSMSDILNDLMEEHSEKREKMMSNYFRYTASKAPDGVPVFSRKFADVNKINRKVNNPFDADIIDVKLGYMVGNPIIYIIDRTDFTKDDIFDEETYKKTYKAIDDFNRMNNNSDKDAETLKMASICGYGARLLYIDKEGKCREMTLYPWECIFVNDGSLDEPQYAMRYYEVLLNGKPQTYVEWYDDRTVSYYISEGEVQDKSGNKKRVFVPYQKDGKSIMPHMFSGVPLIQFLNNEEAQGDCDKVYSEIDAYDATTSDVSSELEQFRLAYMAFYGMAPDADTMAMAKTTGAFGLPDPECKVEFITKVLNDAIIEHHLDRLEKNIYKFAKSVNFTDEDFSGNASGVAMKYKMFGLESKCVISERKFSTSLRTQYKLLTSVWAITGTKIDYLKVDFIWTRNFPLNLLDESQTTMNLKGMVSEKTRLGLLTFVDDPDKELKQMQKENEGTVDLEEPELDEDGNPIVKTGETNVFNE